MNFSVNDRAVGVSGPSAMQSPLYSRFATRVGSEGNCERSLAALWWRRGNPSTLDYTQKRLIDRALRPASNSAQAESPSFLAHIYRLPRGDNQFPVYLLSTALSS